MLTETALHASRHARVLARRAHRRDVVISRQRHQASRTRILPDFTEDTLLARVFQRQQERAEATAQVNREMARIKGKPSLFQRLTTIFRRTP